MKKGFLISVTLAAVMVSTAAFAASAPTTIGVVNVEKIFGASSLVKSQKKKLQAEFKSKQNKLQTQQAQFKKMMDKYQRDKAVMSKTQLKDMETKMAAQQTKLMQMQQTYAQQANDAQTQATQTFMTNLQAASKKVAQSKHLQLIVPNTSVIYSDGTLDVTQAVESAM